MVRLVYPRIRIQAWIDHNPVNEVINHDGDGVDTAEPVVKTRRILCSHPCLLFRLRMAPLLFFRLEWIDFSLNTLDVEPAHAKLSYVAERHRQAGSVVFGVACEGLPATSQDQSD